MNIGRIFSGLLITAFGVFLLLGKYGIVDWSLWYYLAQFWPVLLIIWGIHIFTRKSWLSTSLLLIALVIGFSFWGFSEYRTPENYIAFNQEAWGIDPNVEEAKFKLDYGAGKLKIKQNPTNSLDFSYSPSLPKPFVSSNINGKKAEYKIKQTEKPPLQMLTKTVDREWDLRLPQDIIWDLEMEVGAVKADLDFNLIDLSSLDLSLGASDISLIFGDIGRDTTVDIEAGVANIKILVPETVNLQFSLDGAINNLNLEAAGLVKSGNYYITPNSRSSTKLEIKLAGGINNVEIIRTQTSPTII